MNRLKLLFLLCVSTFIMCSCSNDLFFSEVKSIDDSIWNVDSVLNFEFTVGADDINDGDTLNTNVVVRHSGTYEYQNLWFFVRCEMPDSTVLIDTVDVYMADNFGRWIGNSSIGSLYTVSVPLNKQVVTKEGLYKVSLVHGMRMEAVANITDVGLNVMKVSQ